MRLALTIVVSLLVPYVAGRGAQPVCGVCHPKETARYLESAMGKSVGRPASLPSGRVIQAGSGSTISVEERGGQMVHRLTARGLTAEYPIGYQIGAGKAGYSYVVEIGGYLLQSPASYFKRSGWDISPGYENVEFLEFDRVVKEACLFCHTDAARLYASKPQRSTSPILLPISCERCHGPSGDHVRKPSAKNIVNPAKLPPQARDSVCEQCHLEGEARILNPGKRFMDFRPGDDLEETLAVYIPTQNGRSVRAVSHAEQLAESWCARLSGGKLWCGTCHNPHGQTVDRSREIRDICMTCHRALSKPAHVEGHLECASCHMPARAPKDISHTAVTDHRIRRQPGREDEASAANIGTLVAWREPPAEFRQRDLGLASLQAASKHKLQSLGEAGVKLLASLPPSQQNEDPEVLTSLGALMLDQDLTRSAVALCRRAVEKQPENAQNALDLGITLSKSGDLLEAARQFSRAIDLDPSLERAYLELSDLYEKQGQSQQALETLDRYLRWNPQSILIRLAKVAK
jgi:predicted CXXCH cytochrome family protein